ncbi:MAG: hypothetical protein CSYNP_01018 [Syntrophus sp. SKADARSKE-3]|nr:hypothetical protein [Syntrophus sp. SKADARSKE-3]
MTKQTTTRRQKDISRLLREKKKIQNSVVSKTRKVSEPRRRPKRKVPDQRLPKELNLSSEDNGQIIHEGLTFKQVADQLAIFEAGSSFIALNRPCRINDGIVVVAPEMHKHYTDLHDEAAAKGRLIKFVPASGAASRMFKDWYGMMDAGRTPTDAEAEKLTIKLRRYAFMEDLGAAAEAAGWDLDTLIAEKRFDLILSLILTPKGLNYGQLPKALLKFHAYSQGSRTAIDEHLVEAAQYVKDSQKISRLHITVSDVHLALLRAHLEMIIDDYKRRFDTVYDIGLSTQKSSTNTIAVDLGNRPFRLEDGRLCFRPGGHGALLENLNAIDGDIIFLKNIDNIVPDHLRAATVLHKKILCGYLIKLQEEIFRYLRILENSQVDEDMLSRISAFCREKLHIVFPAGFSEAGAEEKSAILAQKLNRPLRVCGMVKNESEPGGGPFWIEEDGGAQSLQIVESHQIDQGSEHQQSQWRMATHFNPVDLVCGVRDYKGEKFDLRRFVDARTVSITIKSEKGRDLKALEHPGLWNGAMADWTTVFIEVPIETFNPVKTIEDLLRPAHQPAY